MPGRPGVAVPEKVALTNELDGKVGFASRDIRLEQVLPDVRPGYRRPGCLGVLEVLGHDQSHFGRATLPARF